MAVLLAVCIEAGAQDRPVTKGGWSDFGAIAADSVVTLDCSEAAAGSNSPLFYADMRTTFEVSFSACFNTLLTEQAALCKEGRRGELYADLTVGYDPSTEQIFAEIKDRNGELHRIFAGERVTKGRWFDIAVRSQYNPKRKRSTLTLTVRTCDNGAEASQSVVYKGYALPYNVSRWVVGDRIYAFVGEDKAGVGGWFNMPHWVAYSSSDMVNWTNHGVVMRAADFPHANPYGAWAAQMVERDGKYYFYVTLDDTRNGKHMIDVAVSDSPTGPYAPARSESDPLITDDMTPDSHRANADIDPTVFIDDDGTPWMAWGNGDCYIVRLKPDMTHLDGEIRHVGLRNYSEGPWLFKRKGLYYMVYAADAPGVQPEQIAYATAQSRDGPWSYRGLLTSSARHGFTIHPSVNRFKGKWYFFYHDGSYMLDGQPGGDCRRHVCVERLRFRRDGSIRPVELTEKGIALR